MKVENEGFDYAQPPMKKKPLLFILILSCSFWTQVQANVNSISIKSGSLKGSYNNPPNESYTSGFSEISIENINDAYTIRFSQYNGFTDNLVGIATTYKYILSNIDNSYFYLTAGFEVLNRSAITNSDQNRINTDGLIIGLGFNYSINEEISLVSNIETRPLGVGLNVGIKLSL